MIPAVKALTVNIIQIWQSKNRNNNEKNINTEILLTFIC